MNDGDTAASETGLLTMSQAAERLKLGNGNIARVRLQANDVPLVRLHARTYLIRESDLAAFMATRKPRGRPKKGEADATND